MIGRNSILLVKPGMKKAVTISLVRHGHVHNPRAVFYGRLPGFGLDAQGRQEALRAGRALRAKNLAAVFSSPLLRARQTARELLACSGAQPLRISRLLTEVYTAFDGRPSAEVDALNDDIYTGAAPGFERGAHLLQQPDAGGRIEVVQEVGEQHDVVRAAEIDFESAAGQRLVPAVEVGLACVRSRDFEHRRPVDGENARFGVLPGDFDAEQAMARGDVEYAQRSGSAFQHDRTQ